MHIPYSHISNKYSCQRQNRQKEILLRTCPSPVHHHQSPSPPPPPARMLTPNFLMQSSSSSQRENVSMSLVTKEMKAKAEVYHGDQTCREKFMLLLADIGLPVGLLTLDQGIEECGFVKEVGFVWLRHKGKKEHRFENVVVWFDTEVTAYFERNKIKNLTGVKAKEFLIWISLCEICVNSPNGSVITFKTLAGLSKSFPISVFKNDRHLPRHDHGDWNEEVKKNKRAREICAVQV